MRRALVFALVGFVFFVGLVHPTTADAATCPVHTGTDWFVNPVAARPSSLVPTGVKSPAGCAFKTLTQGLGAAGAGERVIAFGASRKPATFKSETLPVSIPPLVTLTTADDPAVGGTGLAPKRYVINFNEGPATAAVFLFSASTFRGFTVKNLRSTSATDAVEANSNFDLDSVVIEGKSPSGGQLSRGFWADGAGTAANLTVMHAGDGLFHSGAGTTVADNAILNANVNGAVVDVGALELTGKRTRVLDNSNVGLLVNPGAALDLSGDDLTRLSDPHPIVARSGNTGIVVNGTLTGRNYEVSSNGGHGVFIETGDPVSMNNIQVRDNVGHGIDISGETNVLELTGDRPTSASLTRISGNGGFGVHVGGVLPITAVIGDADITNNAMGVSIEDQNGLGVPIVVRLDDNNIFSNKGTGAYIRPSDVTFVSNTIHHNAANQLVFDGGNANTVYQMNSPTDMCDSGTNAIYGYSANDTLGIWVKNIADVTVKHTSFEGGGTGLKDGRAQWGSTLSISSNCTAAG